MFSRDIALFVFLRLFPEMSDWIPVEKMEAEAT